MDPTVPAQNSQTVTQPQVQPATQIPVQPSQPTPQPMQQTQVQPLVQASQPVNQETNPVGEKMQTTQSVQNPTHVGKRSPLRRVLFFFVVLLLIIGAGTGGYFLANTKKTANIAPSSYVQQAEIVPTVTVTADLTANWKTYTDSRLNFTIKYPPSWKILNLTPSNFALEKPGESGMLNAVVPPDYPQDPAAILYGGVFFQAFKVDSSQALLDWVSKNGYQLNPVNKVSYQPTTIAGKEAVEANFVQTQESFNQQSGGQHGGPLPVGYKARYVYIKNGDIILGLEASGNMKNPAEDLDLFSQMLTTFQLPSAQSIDTSSWKTYQSKSYSLIYPRTWLLMDTNNNLAADSKSAIWIYNPATMKEGYGNGGDTGKQVPSQFIVIDSLISSQTPQQYINSVTANNPLYTMSSTDIKQITIGGLSGESYMEQGEGNRGRIYVVSNGSILFLFNLSKNDPTSDATLSQIFSSIKFN